MKTEKYFVILTFVFLFVLMAVGYVKYIHNVDYYVYEYLECDPSENGCYEDDDGEPYAYYEFYGGDIKEYCDGISGEECIELLINEDLYDEYYCDAEEEECYEV